MSTPEQMLAAKTRFQFINRMAAAIYWGQKRREAKYHLTREQARARAQATAAALPGLFATRDVILR